MDIVEELRATPETGADPDMIFEAADEIERLRAALLWISDNGPDDAFELRQKALDALDASNTEAGG